jgi:hypothetical protein
VIRGGSGSARQPRGHVSKSVTLRVYAHVDADLRAAAERLG